ncbi:hypothetical protein M422DRAFT_23522 [Sphaerobolus stellatus SS14]|nr:hypothetical protein M422DRAFT_23522 [Sphaerobolus stellatus SS14]
MVYKPQPRSSHPKSIHATRGPTISWITLFGVSASYTGSDMGSHSHILDDFNIRYPYMWCNG